ncbi:MAG: ABC transporter ATP-binding protein [Verrucomicrobia bacterium]|nr:ABC transporter ATP-binding protein [Verrucomicrobiota bacterium]MBI3870845.1 ABC transporter ATP-binding protein [Verrucomicrobiota bacterium]
MALLEIENLRKSYRTPDGTVSSILDIPRFSLEARQQIALRGASGCGKTTFLHLIAGLLRPDSGRITLSGTELTALSESRRDAFRARTLGYVFQTFNLLQGHTALENVLLGMSFGAGEDRDFARSLLERVGLADRMNHLPRQLSSGQQQRVAVARALASRPQLILADEPTGNLDDRRAAEALALIRESCSSQGVALLLVSHDPEILRRFDPVQDFHQLNLVAREEGPL